MIGSEFKKLFERKFGNKRGYQIRGAAALDMRQGNLSNYLRNANSSVPQKYIDTLNALPDYAPPFGITQELYEDGAVNQLITWFTVRLTPQSAANLEFIARVHTKPTHQLPDLGANEDATARLMELVLNQYREYLYATDPGACVATNRVINREKEEARRQLHFELSERKHLVADELTENEIQAADDAERYNDETDPLS